MADPDAFGADEDAMLDTVLSTVVGADNYPGDSATAPNWPTTGPGTRGVLNAMSPKWFSVADDLVALAPKPPVTWVRGSRRCHRQRHVAVRPGLPRSARRGPRLAGRGGLPAAADGRPDPGGAGALRRGRRLVHRGRARRLRPLAPHRAPGRVPRRPASACGWMTVLAVVYCCGAAPQDG